MSTNKYLSGTISTVLDTSLIDLASNALVVSSAFDNSSNLHLWAEVEISATFATTPVVNSGVSVWFLRNLDGTNYEDGDTSITPARAPDLVLPVRAVSTQQRVTRRCAIPPGTFKILLKNETGVALSASGHTLKLITLTYQAV